MVTLTANSQKGAIKVVIKKAPHTFGRRRLFALRKLSAEGGARTRMSRDTRL